MVSCLVFDSGKVVEMHGIVGIVCKVQLGKGFFNRERREGSKVGVAKNK